MKKKLKSNEILNMSLANNHIQVEKLMKKMKKKKKVIQMKKNQKKKIKINLKIKKI